VTRKGEPIEVIRSADCGNSPKNALVESLTIALLKRDAGAVLANVTGDVEWRIAGGPVLRGRDAVVRALREDAKDGIASIRIDHALTHGRAGAVSGRVTFRGGRGFEFCDVHELSNAKGTSVSRITSYRIEC